MVEAFVENGGDRQLLARLDATDVRALEDLLRKLLGVLEPPEG